MREDRRRSPVQLNAFARQILPRPALIAILLVMPRMNWTNVCVRCTKNLSKNPAMGKLPKPSKLPNRTLPIQSRKTALRYGTRDLATQTYLCRTAGRPGRLPSRGHTKLHTMRRRVEVAYTVRCKETSLCRSSESSKNQTRKYHTMSTEI